MEDFWIALLLILVAYLFFRTRTPRFKSRPRIRRGVKDGRKFQRGVKYKPEIHPRVAPQTTQVYSAAKVVRVIDGDTVEIILSRRRIRVRLDSIDCPENGQHWGDTAKFGLIKLIGGQTVSLEIHGLDIHGRTLATIYVSQNRGAKIVNVNERMVALGHAWVMRKYYNHLPQQRRDSLNRIEAWAKSKKVGLWKSQNPIPPWEWRGSNGRR